MKAQTSRQRAGSPAADLAPESLLSRPSIVKRLLVALLVAVVALPVLPLGVVAGWTALFLLVSGVEQLIARRRGGGDLPDILVTFALAALAAVAAATLIRFGDGGGRFFAVALMGFSSVNALLRFYNAPRLFLGAIAPHAAVLGWVCWATFQRHIAAGAYFEALTPPAVVLMYVLLVAPTRKRLAEAWARLVEAKADAEQASRAKSEFLATMSHEIRTPLNGVLGMAQAMQAEALSPAQRARLKVIRRSGENLLSILDDALDLSRVEAGELRLADEEFDMEHVTRGAVATFTELASRKGLSFEFSIAEEAKGTFRGDPVRLRQILYNLVSNAVKFTESGGVGVAVSYRDERIVIEVADSGQGIPQEKIEQLFDMFVQGDGSATRRFGGAGLGLAICRRLTDLMGGRIQVSSVEGRGSIFTATLPMPRQAPPKAPAPAEPPAAPEAATGPAVRILAAEDNQVNQLVLKTLLSQAGVAPTVVENGAEALDAWRREDWDVILMDIQMPVMDGVTATREIRAQEAAGRRPRTPIIAVTANAMTHQLAEYAACGMDLVVPKPLDAAKLFQAIESALESRSLAA